MTLHEDPVEFRDRASEYPGKRKSSCFSFVASCRPAPTLDHADRPRPPTEDLGRLMPQLQAKPPWRAASAAAATRRRLTPAAQASRPLTTPALRQRPRVLSLPTPTAPGEPLQTRPSLLLAQPGTCWAQECRPVLLTEVEGAFLRPDGAGAPVTLGSEPGKIEGTPRVWGRPGRRGGKLGHVLLQTEPGAPEPGCWSESCPLWESHHQPQACAAGDGAGSTPGCFQVDQATPVLGPWERTALLRAVLNDTMPTAQPQRACLLGVGAKATDRAEMTSLWFYSKSFLKTRKVRIPSPCSLCT